MSRAQLRSTLVACMALIPATMCGIGTAVAQVRAVIEVPDPSDTETDPVTQLYRAINDPANENAIVLVRAGEYLLDPAKDEFGQDGYLAPPPGMEIRGENTYRDIDDDGVWDEVDWDGTMAFADPETETVIDASDLEVVFTDMSPKPRSVLGLGRGQVIRSLTLRNFPQRSLLLGALIGIHHHAEGWDGGLRAEVYDCLVERSMEGIFLGNHPSAEDRPLSRFRVEGNVVRDMLHGGIVLINRDDAVSPGPSEAYVAHNRVFGVSSGVIAFGGIGLNANQSFRVVSVGNVYERNERGALYYGSYYSGTGNTLHITSIGDRVWNNGTSWGSYAGGMIAVGGVTDYYVAPEIQEDATNNEVRLEIFDGRFVFGGDPSEENRNDGLRRDILLVGGSADPPADADGNSVHLLLRNTEIGDEETAFEIIVDGIAGEHEGSNEVTVDDDLGLMDGADTDDVERVEDVDAGAGAEPSADAGEVGPEACDAECDGCSVVLGSHRDPTTALFIVLIAGLALRGRRARPRAFASRGRAPGPWTVTVFRDRDRLP